MRPTPPGLKALRTTTRDHRVAKTARFRALRPFPSDVFKESSS